MKKLSREVKYLLSLFAFRDVSDLFLGTFFVSFIMQLSTNEIVSVAQYRLFEYTATCAGFFLFANWCKRYNKVAVFSLNLIPKIALLLAIILLGDTAVEYVIPLGMLYGIGSALYCLPTNTMIGEKVDSKSMSVFFGAKNAIKHATKLIAPVVLGYFIDLGSYNQVAYFLLGMSVIELAMTLKLTPSRHRSDSPVDFVGFFRCMLRFRVVRHVFIMESLRAFSMGLLGTVITMYTVYMFQTDLNLGIFTTLFALCSVLSSWVTGRYFDRRTWPMLLVVCMFLMIGGLAIFIWKTTPVTFLIYSFVYSTALIAIEQIINVKMFDLSQSKCISANHKVEYFVFRDCALYIGRWVGFTGLMYVGVFGGYAWLRWYLVAIAVAMLFAGLNAYQLCVSKRRNK